MEPSAADPSYTRAGWREWVGLPGLGVEWIKAKLDTGARTSALHAFDLDLLDDPDGVDGARLARFAVHPWQATDDDPVVVTCPVVDVREVRSSSGQVEVRPVVVLDVALVGRVVPAEVTLANRDEMGFRMLVGREALRRGYVVDPAHSYVGGRPKLAVRRRNRGR